MSFSIPVLGLVFCPQRKNGSLCFRYSSIELNLVLDEEVGMVEVNELFGLGGEEFQIAFIVFKYFCDVLFALGNVAGVLHTASNN